MTPKTCVDCGVALTGLSSFFGGRCVDCARVPYARAKAFFDRTPLTEQDIQNWKFSKSNKTLLGYALFLFACIAVGSLVGFGKGGTYQGLGYAFVATLLGIVFFRWRMKLITVSPISVHPLDVNRWFNFAFPYTFILFFAWAMAYMGWMPTLVGTLIAPGSIFSHHVRITPTVSLPAFGLVLLVGVVALIVGMVVGFFNVSRHDAKNKTRLLAQFHRWQQSNS